jgi:hypothetical protein
MPNVSRRVKGSFVSLVHDPVPVLAIQTHQIDAVARPRTATKSLTAALPKRTRSALERHINDRLSGRQESDVSNQ